MSEINEIHKQRARALAEAHWVYVRDLLYAHNLTDAQVDPAAFHYNSAFEHGYKHAIEDVFGGFFGSNADMQARCLAQSEKVLANCEDVE